MLSPSGDWFWYMDDESQHLAISLGNEMCFLTAYSGSDLTPFGNKPVPFNLDHLKAYSIYVDALESSDLPYNRAEKTQVALNATAARFFHRPVSPKSWYFDVSDKRETPQYFHAVSTELDSSLVMIIEQYQNLCTCLLLNHSLAISESKTFKQFSLIKVQEDRLHESSHAKALHTAIN